MCNVCIVRRNDIEERRVWQSSPILMNAQDVTSESIKYCYNQAIYQFVDKESIILSTSITLTSRKSYSVIKCHTIRYRYRVELIELSLVRGELKEIVTYSKFDPGQWDTPVPCDNISSISSSLT